MRTVTKRNTIRTQQGLVTPAKGVLSTSPCAKGKTITDLLMHG